MSLDLANHSATGSARGAAPTAPARSGSGDSVAGLPPGVRPAPAGRRLAAHLLDAGLGPALLVLAVAAARLVGPAGQILPWLLAAAAISWVGLVWWLLATRAVAPGLFVARLRLVGLHNGRPLGGRRVALRTLVLTLLRLSGIGLIALLAEQRRHPRGQGWHDLAVDALVIAAPAAPMVAAGSVVSAGSTGPVSPEHPSPPGISVSRSPVIQGRVRSPGPAEGTSAVWTAVVDDGRRLALDRVHVLGRNPSLDIGEDAVPVVIEDATRTVSKTHLEIGVAAGAAYVVDRGSTNGSTVTSSAGSTTACTPGCMVVVDAGALVTFGDRHLRVQADPAA